MTPADFRHRPHGILAEWLATSVRCAGALCLYAGPTFCDLHKVARTSIFTFEKTSGLEIVAEVDCKTFRFACHRLRFTTSRRNPSKASSLGKIRARLAGLVQIRVTLSGPECLITKSAVTNENATNGRKLGVIC